MGRVVGLILVLAVAVGGLGFVFKGLDSQVKRLKFENERSVLKAKFQARMPHLIQSDDEHAAFDLVSAVKSYGKDLAELYKKYPEFRDPDWALKRYEQDYKDKKIDEKKMQGIRERTAMVRAVWEKLLKGEYKPVAVAHDKSIRVDLHTIEKKASEGEEKLFVHVLILGILADKSLSYGTIAMDVPLEDDEATAKKRKAGQLKDLKQERKAQISGQGEPNTLIPEPDKWVEDFPPGMGVAFYNFPMFPGEAKGLELTLGYEVKNPGGGHVVNELKYKIPLDASWKLPAGAAFGADEANANTGDDE
ncbi:MAG: hypothetical protein HY904_06925 [Deltaproteobacteria bacterium]|nr:hypothetical protein [Deltaproteobacteria bacterium]